MRGSTTTCNTKLYKLCHKIKVNQMRTLQIQQSLDKANNVVGWEGGR